ncbi:SurA N-terminal domain-containing protein [Endothiovibrio diazotrophicus]
MLQSIRDRATGWIAWVVIILISIPFALWGIQEYTGAGGPVLAATVNGSEIPLRTLQQEMQTERSRLQQALGPAASQFISDEALRKQVLQGLIDRELRRQSAYSVGFRVGDEQVAREIDSIDAFKQDGHFDQQRYERVLMRNDFSPKRFEEQLRGDMLTTQLRQGVVATALVTPQEANAYLALRDQQRNFRYLLIAPDARDDAVAVSDEEVAKEYEANRSAFMEPEQVKVEYLELTLNHLMDAVKVDEAAVRSLYEEQKARYQRKEERKASHILLTVEKGADQQRIDQVRAEAMSLVERIRAGEDFSVLAKEFSQDPGSAAKGGDLGFFSKGMMVGPFEDAVFSMKVGEVSDPVRSPYGFHVIRLEEVKPGGTETFETVRDSVEREVRRRQAEGLFVEQEELLTSVAFENPTSLEVPAKELGLPVQTSDWFSRDVGTGVAVDPKVRAAAFEPDVLEGGNNSTPVELGTDRMVVVRRLDRKPVAAKPLEAVREQIVSQLRARAGRELARKKGEEILAAARGGEALRALAEANGLELKEETGVPRSGSEVEPAQLVEALFRLRRPGEEGAVFEGVPLGDGGYAVVELTGVVDGDPAKLTDAERKSELGALARGVGAAEFSDLMSGLRARADIEIAKSRQGDSR